MAEEPSAPDAASRERLIAVLADFVAKGGAARFLAAPVVPGEAAFPEPWQPTRAGVAALLRRLAWHAGQARAIAVVDERLGAPPTERKPQTRVELTEVRAKELCFSLGFLGSDDIPGTLAHELGVAHAALTRPGEADPYRSAEPPAIAIDPDRDFARGSLATVYLGLGVLAANAAFQEYAWSGRFNGAYNPLEYEVVRAGFVPMSDLAYLLAVQAAVRGEPLPPPGLSGPARDEVAAWLAVLFDRRAALRERLGIAPDARGEPRDEAVRFPDVELELEAPAPRTAFRWQSHRGGVGFVAGAVFGGALALAMASRGLPALYVVGGMGAGHAIGRRVRVPRCTACASVVPVGADPCPACGASLRGDIARLADRLDAEEELADRDRPRPRAGSAPPA